MESHSVGINNMRTKKILFFWMLIFAFASFICGTAVDIVYVTANGRKYHKKNCRVLMKSKEIIGITIVDAEKKGYEPCKICNPSIEIPKN